MDIDAYVSRHRGEWQRLETLLRRNRVSGAEADELVTLYTRAATSLSLVRSTSPDPALVDWLSSLVARARSAVTGASTPAYRDLGRFLTVTFPAVLYRTWRWWAATSAVSLLVALALGWWVATHPDVQASLITPDGVKQLVEQDFANYYTANPAQSFAAQVWTNNAWVAALCIALGVLIVPVVFILFQNAANVGIVGGLMAAHDRLGLFLGLITPHGLLELTAVFVAAGVGLKVGWAWVDPGPRTRVQALGEEGRAAVAVALGLILVLFVSGILEAFVTPSPLPTWARIAIGVLAEVAFLTYVVVLGGRAARANETGDLARGEGADVAPVAA